VSVSRRRARYCRAQVRSEEMDADERGVLEGPVPNGSNRRVSGMCPPKRGVRGLRTVMALPRASFVRNESRRRLGESRDLERLCRRRPRLWGVAMRPDRLRARSRPQSVSLVDSAIGLLRTRSLVIPACRLTGAADCEREATWGTTGLGHRVENDCFSSIHKPDTTSLFDRHTRPRSGVTISHLLQE
jgi:hypothetical protein